jgi:hypothetical protein
MDIKNVVVQNWYGWEGFGISCRWCMEPLNESPHELLNVEELLELVKAATHECAPQESFEVPSIPVHDDGPYRDPATGKPL